METRCNLIPKVSKSQSRRRFCRIYSKGFLVSALIHGGFKSGIDSALSISPLSDVVVILSWSLSQARGAKEKWGEFEPSMQPRKVLKISCGHHVFQNVDQDERP